MEENGIATIIVDAAYKVHTQLGPGLLESVYVAVLAYEINSRGLETARQVRIPVTYEGLVFEEGFRADLVVNGLVIVEVKSVEANHPVHRKQLLTYLKLSGKRLGLLVNFGLPLFRDGVCRVVNGLPG
ncbi:hypothetical protein LBMAG42_42630 [Deltaproteobacteria bacterium]|nr:hypothetical protein LBMAG42_42630 [Deltaproteobacteria bacterium]